MTRSMNMNHKPRFSHILGVDIKNTICWCNAKKFYYCGGGGGGGGSGHGDDV